MNSYFVERNGVKSGPHSGLVIREMASNGKLERTDYIVRERDGVRVLAANVPQLRIAFHSSTGSALPPPVSDFAKGRLIERVGRVFLHHVRTCAINPTRRWKAIGVVAIAASVLLFGVVLGSRFGSGTPVSSSEQPTRRPIQTEQSPPPIAVPQATSRSSEMDEMAKFLGALAELGRQSAGARQPASAQAFRQQCLQCNGTGRYICIGCRGSGMLPNGTYCSCMTQTQYGPPPACRTCGGTGWR